MQVIPALDPKTPIWAAGYTMQLVTRRMQEFSLWEPNRFRVFQMRERFQLGPFECAPIAQLFLCCATHMHSSSDAVHVTVQLSQRTCCLVQAAGGKSR